MRNVLKKIRELLFLVFQLLTAKYCINSLYSVLLSWLWMNPLFLWCFTEIYNPHQNRFFHLFFFCHRVLMSLQLKCPSALCLTLRCLFVWLINHNALSPLYKHYHPHSSTVGITPALATPTQLSDQTQLHVPFISAGAAWPRGSSVNLWSQSIIYSPTRPRALYCH